MQYNMAATQLPATAQILELSTFSLAMNDAAYFKSNFCVIVFIFFFCLTKFMSQKGIKAKHTRDILTTCITTGSC